MAQELLEVDEPYIERLTPTSPAAHVAEAILCTARGFSGSPEVAPEGAMDWCLGADFRAPGELSGIGGNLFLQSPHSGEPVIGFPNQGGRGQIYDGALEQSNVDLSNEFTQMIINQRGFQASSRTVTTADQMLTELINLKR